MSDVQSEAQAFLRGEVKNDLNSCEVCGKTEDLLSCARCRLVQYCSRECQKKDWKQHKPQCMANFTVDAGQLSTVMNLTKNSEEEARRALFRSDGCLIDALMSLGYSA
eukprot:GCRY01002791.1.p1 GENE.GCRY01002791.1~~GCRY01002791.1.p1  ORF type:complete len:120 (-),score=11.00 GCRY01002791.1:69-392(-)